MALCSLPTELHVYNISKYLDIKSTCNVQLVCSDLYHLYSDKNLIQSQRKKVYKLFQQKKIKSIFLFENYHKYRMLAYNLEYLLNMHIKRYSIGYIFAVVCDIGNKELINIMMNKYKYEPIEAGVSANNTNKFFDQGLRGACGGGQEEIINLMIEKGATDWDWGLSAVCYKGPKNHEKIVEMMIAKGAMNLQFSFRSACAGGNKKIAELMIEKGAIITEAVLSNSFGDACKFERTEIIDWLIEKGATSWEIGLCGACTGGHKEIAEMMIEKGANNFNECLYGACVGDKKQLIEMMIDKGADDWNLGLIGACKGGHTKIVNMMLKKGATDWNAGLSRACYGGSRKIIKMMIDKGANHWNRGLLSACEGGRKKIIKMMIAKGADIDIVFAYRPRICHSIIRYMKTLKLENKK